MKVFKAPHSYEGEARPFLFLAGSIEMGAAENWQTRVEQELASVSGTILNPRRDDWDSSWVQHPISPQFRQQVEWELDALDAADCILMYFDSKTKSPISLLELGLYAHRNKLVVCCPEDFWRYGNVAIVCERYKIPLYHILNLACFAVRQQVVPGICSTCGAALVRGVTHLRGVTDWWCEMCPGL